MREVECERAIGLVLGQICAFRRIPGFGRMASYVLDEEVGLPCDELHLEKPERRVDGVQFVDHCLDKFVLLIDQICEPRIKLWH